jgi:hypothetical protein
LKLSKMAANSTPIVLVATITESRKTEERNFPYNFF